MPNAATPGRVDPPTSQHARPPGPSAHQEPDFPPGRSAGPAVQLPVARTGRYSRPQGGDCRHRGGAVTRPARLAGRPQRPPDAGARRVPPVGRGQRLGTVLVFPAQYRDLSGLTNAPLMTAGATRSLAQPCGCHHPKLRLNKPALIRRRFRLLRVEAHEGATETASTKGSPAADGYDARRGSRQGRYAFGYWTQRDEVIPPYCVIRVHLGLRPKRVDRPQREHRMDVSPPPVGARPLGTSRPPFPPRPNQRSDPHNPGRDHQLAS